MSNKKWAAFGAFVMVKVEVPQDKKIILVNPQATVDMEPIGEVVSVGAKADGSQNLIGETVRFNGSMVVHQWGDAEKDDHVFLLIPEAAIMAVALPE